MRQMKEIIIDEKGNIRFARKNVPIKSLTPLGGLVVVRATNNSHPARDIKLLQEGHIPPTANAYQWCRDYLVSPGSDQHSKKEYAGPVWVVVFYRAEF